MPGKLYIVGTPIGNLEDITLRALRILNEVDVIAAEDTRHTVKLLNHFELKKHLLAYHQHNEQSGSEKLLELWQRVKILPWSATRECPLSLTLARLLSAGVMKLESRWRWYPDQTPDFAHSCSQALMPGPLPLWGF